VKRVGVSAFVFRSYSSSIFFLFELGGVTPRARARWEAPVRAKRHLATPIVLVVLVLDFTFVHRPAFSIKRSFFPSRDGLPTSK
jgi:hypothetical protein